MDEKDIYERYYDALSYRILVAASWAAWMSAELPTYVAIGVVIAHAAAFLFKKP